jgi:hypothetical protein
MDIDQSKTMEEDVRMLLARIEEVYGHDVWANKNPSTDLEQAAQQVARHFPPNEKFIKPRKD